MQTTKKELAAIIAERHDLSKAKAEAIISSFCDLIVEEIDSNNEVVINGFGKFSPKANAARTGRNPATGEALEIAASKGVKFAASKTFKDLLNA